MIDKINTFIRTITEQPIELYSEFGLQHELAIFLRNNFPELNVRLEYPTPEIFNPLPEFIKKEIDIYITTETGQRYVIELKMPKIDSGTPKEMYNAIVDVKFLEELRQNNIDGCYAILFTENSALWGAPRASSHIYQLFNGENVNLQSIELEHIPNFLHKYGPIELANIYSAAWNEYTDLNNKNWKYYILEV